MNNFEPYICKISPKRLLGFDTAGELFIENDQIFRGVYPEYESRYRTILETCKKNDLFRLGIVNTQEKKGYHDPDNVFGLVLEHERIPFITYPHEWSASMLKDAASFHDYLFIHLEKYGLTLKDWHPYNILFKNTNPVFVDFLSIIPIESLENEEYLSSLSSPIVFRKFWDTRSKYLFEMYKRMYIPYFLLPLRIMAQKHYKKCRKMIFETTLNASASTLTSRDVFGVNILGRIQFAIRELFKKIALLEKSPDKNKFFQMLSREVQYLEVQPPSSAYVNYYDLKNENFEFCPNDSWTNKQKVIYEQIQLMEPDTVLDIACNTGWFSILAAKNGCSVVAVDIDESCVDKLYEYSKNECLDILPLVIDISNGTDELYPLTQSECIYDRRMSDSTPLVSSMENRLKCDIVLVLALIHHLVLGQNMNFAHLINILYSLSKQCLVLEFVPKTDVLIVENPEFFPAYKSNPNVFEWYTLENIRIELEKKFKRIDIVDSYPESRKLFICTNPVK